MKKKQMYEGLAHLEMLAACRKLTTKEDLTLRVYRAMATDRRIRKEFKKKKDVHKAVAVMREFDIEKSWKKTQELMKHMRNNQKPTT